jgi:hypothetical protein
LRVAAERLQVLVDIVNRSANEARDIRDFHWLKEDRLQNSDLPEVYVQHASSRVFSAEIWKRFKVEGVCLSLRVILDVLDGFMESVE